MSIAKMLISQQASEVRTDEGDRQGLVMEVKGWSALEARFVKFY